MQKQSNKFYTYRTSKQITNISQLPIKSQQRAATDVFCTIVTAIFAIIMFVIACFTFDLNKLNSLTYPTDNNGRKCTLDNPQFNYLYFTTLNDVSKRVCVSQCPNGTQASLKCLPTDDLSCAKNTNPNFQVNIYSTIDQETSLGLFCFPTDQSAKQELFRNTDLQDKLNFVKSYRSVWISVGAAFVLGVIFLLLNYINCMIRPMLYFSVVFGGLCFLGNGALFIFWNLKQYKYYSPIIFVLAAVMIFFGILLLTSLCVRNRHLNICGNYLVQGVNVLKKQPGLLLLIPIFLILKFGLLALCVFQLLAYWSNSQLKFNKNQIYYSTQGNFRIVMLILDVIQFIWGLCFIREVYNFIISGCSVTHTFLHDSQITKGVKLLFRFHWGSVVASSFAINFFFLPDLIYSFIKVIFGCKCCQKTCSPIDRLFGFARSETMAFINILGLPYCNSSRWCQRLHHLTNMFTTNQSVFRYFSLGSHGMLATLATSIGFLYETKSGVPINQLAIIFSLALNTFIITYFVTLFQNLGESRLMCELVQNYLQGKDFNPDIQQSQQDQQSYRPRTVKVADGQKDIYQSHVNEGYQILHTKEK